MLNESRCLVYLSLRGEDGPAGARVQASSRTYKPACDAAAGVREVAGSKPRHCAVGRQQLSHPSRAGQSSTAKSALQP